MARSYGSQVDHPAGDRQVGAFATVAFVAILLVGFAVRLRAIRGEDLGLDGGLSVALGKLPVLDALQFLGHDVHPPLYYLLLRLWLAVAGANPFSVKFLSVTFTTLAVAALFGWARSLGNNRVALFATAPFAVAPIAIEASANVREYSLAIALIILTAWAYTHWSPARFVIFGVLSLWSSYLSAGVVAAAAIDAALTSRRRRRIIAVLVVGASILPWIAYASSIGFLQTLGSTGPRGTSPASIPLLSQLVDVPRLVTGGPFLEPFWLGSTLAAVALALLAVSFIQPGKPVTAIRRRPEQRNVQSDRNLLVAAVIASILLAIAVNSSWTRQEIATRYLLPVLPFLLIGFGYAAERAAHRWPGAFLSVGVLVIASALGTWAWLLRPTLPSTVWDPAGLVRFLDQHTLNSDAIVFDSPEQAGYYQALSHEPHTWVLVPVGTAYLQGDVVARSNTTLAPLVGHTNVVWLVLHRDSLGEGSAKIVDWLSLHLFPVTEQKLADSDIAPFVGRPPNAPARTVNLRLQEGIDLVSASYPSTVAPGAPFPVELDWVAGLPIQRNLTVFVHLVDSAGRTWAQHDAPPSNGRQPTTTWGAGSEIFDLHGLILPSDAPPGSYHLDIGLYDGNGRVRLEAGGDTIQLGSIEVESARSSQTGAGGFNGVRLVRS